MAGSSNIENKHWYEYESTFLAYMAIAANTAYVDVA